MKSSLKTFLKGLNPLVKSRFNLRETEPLHWHTEDPFEIDYFRLPDGFWHIDLLDDGTAITYCAVSYKL